MHYVVVGGGVAGVCCAEELCRLCPQDSVALVAADRVLKGVSVVARVSRTLEELQLVEKRLDELPYPNLRMVQGVAAGIDAQGKELLLASGERLPYDKLCICAGARPKELPQAVFHRRAGAGHHGSASSAAGQVEGTVQEQQQQQQLQQQQQQGWEEEQQQQQQDMEALEEEELRQRVLTIRDTDSVARLAQRLAHSQRVAVVGNGGIALELISGLRGLHITWVMRHAHIGDAFFDLDAAQFLLEELQHQRRQQAQQGQERLQAEQDGHTTCPAPQPAAQQSQPQQKGLHAEMPGSTSTIGGGLRTAGSTGAVLGHAVGPRWVQQLAPAAGAASGGEASCGVDLEYGCEIAAIQLTSGQGSAAGAPGGAASPHQQQEQRPQQKGEGAGACSSSNGAAPQEQPALLLTLTNGRQLQADLVLLAIGVTPALDWVPSSLERAPDGGLRANRHMQTSDPSIYAAGDSASCQWAAGESAHWFQMRLWSQARSMGVYAAHCMAGVQDQTGADMAFELFTHVTRFLGKKVVLLGLYNGQRLQEEPASDLVCYSRLTEGPERSFVRVLLLRGRVQGAVLIGETDLEETFENLIMDQLDVSAYGPALLDPDFELDHVFD